MREKVKKLWKLCFNDNDEFVDMYFNLRYNSEVNVAIESGEMCIRDRRYIRQYGRDGVYAFQVSRIVKRSQVVASRESIQDFLCQQHRFAPMTWVQINSRPSQRLSGNCPSPACSMES